MVKRKNLNKVAEIVENPFFVVEIDGYNHIYLANIDEYYSKETKLLLCKALICRETPDELIYSLSEEEILIPKDKITALPITDD